jgi:hypothetical protein
MSQQIIIQKKYWNWKINLNIIYNEIKDLYFLLISESSSKGID